MRTIISNSTMKSKLKYDDIYALILEKKKFINKIYRQKFNFYCYHKP